MIGSGRQLLGESPYKLIFPGNSFFGRFFARIGLILVGFFHCFETRFTEFPANFNLAYRETMKVHPAPKRRNITFHYDINSSLSSSSFLSNRQKKLRRLPHLFNRVLELPFHSDADVLVEENSEEFRFAIATDDFGEDVRAQTIEIYPGVTKIIIRGSNVLELSLDEFELDVWRFRLPPCSKPELASAVYVNGELIVTVPKGDDSDDIGEEWGGGNGDVRGGIGHLVLVQ